jgi:hypothetical protein
MQFPSEPSFESVVGENTPTGQRGRKRPDLDADKSFRSGGIPAETDGPNSNAFLNQPAFGTTPADNAVPEPRTVALTLMGLTLILWLRRS